MTSLKQTVMMGVSARTAIVRFVVQMEQHTSTNVMQSVNNKISSVKENVLKTNTTPHITPGTTTTLDVILVLKFKDQYVVLMDKLILTNVFVSVIRLMLDLQGLVAVDIED